MNFHSLSLIFLFDLLTFHRLKLFPAILLLVFGSKKKDEKNLYGQNLFIYISILDADFNTSTKKPQIGNTINE